MRDKGGTRWGMKAVLVVMAAGCGVGAWYAKDQQPAIGAEAQEAATVTATAYVEDDLAAALKHWSPGDDPAKLRHQLETVILNDSDVTAVRLFDASGALVFSSLVNDETTIDPAVASSVLADGPTVDDSEADTLRTYGRADGLVGAVDQDIADIRGTATLPWQVGQFVLLGAAIVLLGGALFGGNGVRTPKDRSAAPDRETVKQTKQELDGDDPEMKKLRSRAEKAEHSRRAMEDQLNVLRSQILSGDAGSQARVGELEGHLQDAHNRVSGAEERNAELTQRVAELEAAASGQAPAQQRTAALETEVVTSRARIKELETHVKQLEARAAHAETTTAAHTGQLDEAHTKARQAELQVQEAVNRALTAERQVEEAVDRVVAADREIEELRAQLAAVPPPSTTPAPVPVNAGLDDVLLPKLQEELASAQRRANDAEARAARASARAAELAAVTRDAPVTPPVTRAAAPEQPVRELEIALAEARAAAWAAEEETTDEAGFGVVETHAVPEDEEASTQAPKSVDEADAIRTELERMGQIMEHAGEAGDVDGLRDRLTKSAARKKGRSVAEERIARSS